MLDFNDCFVVRDVCKRFAAICMQYAWPNLRLPTNPNPGQQVSQCITELVSLFNPNPVYLWSKPTMKPKNLSLPKSLEVSLFTNSPISGLNSEGVFGISMELPSIEESNQDIKTCLTSISQKSLKNFKVLLLHRISLDEGLGSLIANCGFQQIYLEACKPLNSIDVQHYSSTTLRKLYLTIVSPNGFQFSLPNCLEELIIYGPESQKFATQPVISISATSCTFLHIM